MANPRSYPRFSLRTLAIVVTLVCAYFAAWPPTKKYGVPFHTWKTPTTPKGDAWIINADSPAPLIVQQDVEIYETSATNVYKREYYLWLAILKIKLPFVAYWENRDVWIDAGGIGQIEPFPANQCIITNGGYLTGEDTAAEPPDDQSATAAVAPGPF